MNLHRRIWTGFWLIFLVGAGLRFSALSRQSLWDDEMSTRFDMPLPLRQWPERFRNYETHPPLYFLQLRLWHSVVGDSLYAMRANSALWGSLSLVLLFLLMRLYRDPVSGLWAMALMAVSPFHLAYSQELRPYAMAMALGLGGFFILENVLRRPSRRGWRILGLLWTAQLYTHFWGSFVVLAQALYGFRRSPDRAVRRHLVRTGLISAGLFALWLPILWAQMRTVKNFVFWEAPASPMNLAKTFVAYSGIYFHFASWAFTVSGPMAMKLIVGLLFMTALVLGIRQGPAAAVYWLFVGLGVPYAMSYWRPDLFLWYRFTSLIFPAFILLVVGGAREKLSPKVSRGLLSILVAFGLWGCLNYFTTWQKANPKAVVAYVNSLEKAHTVVVIRPAYFSDLFAYYDRGTAPVIDEHTLSTPDVRAALKGKQMIFVAFEGAPDPVGEALRTEFSVLSQRSFSGYAHLGITVYELR